MSNESFRASLAPIFVTLLSIGSVSLFGFAVAYWPQEPPRANGQGVESSMSVTPQSFDGESGFLPPLRERGRSKWM